MEQYDKTKLVAFIRTIEKVICFISVSLKNQLSSMSKKRISEQKEFVDEIFRFHQLLMKTIIITRYLKKDQPAIMELVQGNNVLSLNVNGLIGMIKILFDGGVHSSQLRKLPYEIEAAVGVLLEKQFNILPKEIQSLITMNNASMDPTPIFTRTSIFLRKFFYLHSSEYPFNSVEILNGMIVCKTPQYYVFLTLKEPSVVYRKADSNVFLEVVSIYLTESGVNWKKMNTMGAKDTCLLNNLNVWVNSRICGDRPMLLNNGPIKINIKEADGSASQFKKLKTFMDKFTTFIHKHILLNKSISQSTKQLYPFLTSKISKMNNLIEVYYWGETAACLKQCPQGHMSLRRPCLIFEYFPNQHQIKVSHNPPIPIELDPTLPLVDQISAVTQYLIEQYKTQIIFQESSLCSAPSFVICPLTGVVKLFNIGLSPSLISYFETYLSIGINHPNVLRGALEDLNLKIKYSSIHTIALMHSQINRLEEPQVSYLSKLPNEVIFRGFPLKYRLSDFSTINVVIEKGIIKMQLQTKGKTIDEEYSNEYVWESFDNLYEFFFNSFELLMQQAYKTSFLQMFLNYFNAVCTDKSFCAVSKDDVLYICHLNLPFVQQLSISIGTYFELTIRGIPTKIPNLVNEQGDYIISTPKTFIDDDINILLLRYSSLLHLALFASFIDPNEVTFEGKKLQFTENTVIIPNILKITFTSTKPETISMDCKVITEMESDQPLFEQMNKDRIKFVFDSDKLDIQKFVLLQTPIANLLYNPLYTIINHSMTCKTEYQLEIYNFFIYTYIVQCDNNSHDHTTHRYPSYYRIIHHFNNEVEVDCRPFNCIFNDTISRTLQELNNKFDLDYLPKILSIIHSVSHLSIISSLLTPPPPQRVQLEQNNSYRLFQFIVSCPMVIDPSGPVIELRQSESSNENSRIFAEYFNRRYCLPQNSNSIASASLYIANFITPSRKDFSNELSILPRTFFECLESCKFSFDFCFKSSSEGLTVELVFTLTNGSRTKIVSSYIRNSWYIISCEPIKNSIAPDFRFYLRSKLEKQDKIHASDGLSKIIQEFKDNQDIL